MGATFAGNRPAIAGERAGRVLSRAMDITEVVVPLARQAGPPMSRPSSSSRSSSATFRAIPSGPTVVAVPAVARSGRKLVRGEYAGSRRIDGAVHPSSTRTPTFLASRRLPRLAALPRAYRPRPPARTIILWSPGHRRWKRAARPANATSTLGLRWHLAAASEPAGSPVLSSI